MSTPSIHHERIWGDGVELHVARAGEGQPVLLLHGFPEGEPSIDRVSPQVKKSEHTLAICHSYYVS